MTMNQNKIKFALLYIKSIGTPISDLAKQVGISEATAYKWMRDEDFKAYLQDKSEMYWESIESKATAKLIENIENNDTKAIIYALDHTRFRDDGKINLGDVEIRIIPTKDDED